MVKGIYINITSKIFSKGNNSRQNHEAIKNLKVNISKGEFCTIIGPSGCGKTTLLNLVAGLDTDMQGEILFGNKKSRAN